MVQCEGCLQNQLKPKSIKKFKATTHSSHALPVSENLLARNFHSEKPNSVWCGDITYISTHEGWLYLAVVLDLYSRKIVGLSMGRRMTSELVCKALKMAITHREIQAPHTLLWHSDRGSQYAALEYQKLLHCHDIHGSMSRKGNCWDNAVTESFFATLKKELVHLTHYKTREEAQRSIFEYIEVFYNRQRLHSTIGYQTPVDYERMTLAA